MKDKLLKLQESELGVFTVEDLSTLWNISDRRVLLESIKYYLRTNRLKSVKRGVYVTHKKYDDLELAQKLYAPSYISLQTALGVHGINFQHYDTVYAVSLHRKKIKIKNKIFSYHSINEQIFWNPLGVKKKEGYYLAEPERAVCDTMYLFPQLGFDYIQELDVKKLKAVTSIYNSQTLENKVKDIIKVLTTPETEKEPRD